MASLERNDVQSISTNDNCDTAASGLYLFHSLTTALYYSVMSDPDA